MSLPILHVAKQSLNLVTILGVLCVTESLGQSAPDFLFFLIFIQPIISKNTTHIGHISASPSPQVDLVE